MIGCDEHYCLGQLLHGHLILMAAYVIQMRLCFCEIYNVLYFNRTDPGDSIG